MGRKRIPHSEPSVDTSDDGGRPPAWGILETAPDATIVTDQLGTVLFANRMTRSFLVTAKSSSLANRSTFCFPFNCARFIASTAVTSASIRRRAEWATLPRFSDFERTEANFRFRSGSVRFSCESN